ncbi:hypothetical protein BigBertha_124 [Bacillus phage BigBertha]|uniref:Uncharacterized protein n=1 Tax=Bacillus phage BigBertha TaxID=1406781 RepID=U5PVL8_9CAUD|nr:hypothetical protein BigBertha_124 [Bacillus phage BigBertha]AGY46632.1 hypothetical protein BigBertha_124 [Bacillus phage BigBertha]
MEEKVKLTGKFVVVEVLKKTSAKGFKNVKVDDVLYFEWDLDGHYKGAPYVDCYVVGEFVDRKSGMIVKTLLHENFLVEETS